MPTNSYKKLPAFPHWRVEGRTPKSLTAWCPSFDFSIPILCGALLFSFPAMGKKKQEVFLPSAMTASISERTQGAIFSTSAYVPLTSGARASQVGDLLTIVLVERTSASKSNSASTDRSGGFGLTPPQTGPLSLFKSSDVNASGNQSFKGKGETAQSNTLTGEVSVTVAAIYPNGTMLVRGEKKLTLNRGDEFIQLSGLVRAVDIGADNRIESTRVANAHIYFTGKGDVARASRQGWLQSLFSKISPF
jgi:flagellar L-ring protein FlgH